MAIWLAGRFPPAADAFAACCAAVRLTAIATAIPTERLTAAAAAPDRPRYRARSLRAMRIATGARPEPRASRVVPRGATRSTPTAAASTPNAANVGRSSPAPATRRTPAANSPSPGAASRWAPLGALGRDASALTAGVRAAARAGHHDATIAVAAASTIAPATGPHGMLARSIRCWRTRSRLPAATTTRRAPRLRPRPQKSVRQTHRSR